MPSHPESVGTKVRGRSAGKRQDAGRKPANRGRIGLGRRTSQRRVVRGAGRRSPRGRVPIRIPVTRRPALGRVTR